MSKEKLKLENIFEIRKAKLHKGGYEIVFQKDKVIWIRKRRPLIGLLLLIQYETCTEADLAGANTRLEEVRNTLKGKINPSWIKKRYRDANKPYSELWTEEGFSFIHAEGYSESRQYVLRPEDHHLLFAENKKNIRTSVSKEEKKIILARQQGRCNICGSLLMESGQINEHTFAKDRVTTEIDHRIPVDHGGESTIDNYQALCHMCNKSKRQRCYGCTEKCGDACALVCPEKSYTVLPTGEDISGRMLRYAYLSYKPLQN